MNACDAGREGELIFRLIAQYAFDGKHAPKPVERLWLQSMTSQAIREGFGRLCSDAQMQGLACPPERAEICRLAKSLKPTWASAFSTLFHSFLLTLRKIPRLLYVPKETHSLTLIGKLKSMSLFWPT